MKPFLSPKNLVAATLMAGLTVTAFAADRATPREARALFDQAVKHLQANGPEKSWSAFNDRQGPFVKKDLYVYVIDKQGVYVANGAAPDSLIGLKVLDSVDAAGNPLFRHMIAVTDKQKEANIRYVWLNRKTNHVEPKHVWLYRQGDYILGVGYYAPRSGPEDAQKLLNEAAAQLKAGSDAANKAFNDQHGNFVRNDLYVFTVDTESGKFTAHGMAPRLVGTDALGLEDVEGKPLIREMIDLAKKKGEASVDYMWRNPVTNAVEKKRSFVRMEGKTLLGVGYYSAE